MDILAPILKTLVLPPGNLLLLAGIGWLISRRWKLAGRITITLSFALLLLFSMPFFSSLLLIGLQKDQALGTNEVTPQASAIVVLGGDTRRFAPEFGGETAGAETLERLRYGAKLHRDLGVPILVTAGAAKKDATPLAEMMAEILEGDFGIPVRWVESEARNTYENAKFTAEILRREGLQKIYLVTHAWHMPRAKRSFESVGLNVVPAPTGLTIDDDHVLLVDFVPKAEALRRSAAALHEYLGILWYELNYYGTEASAGRIGIFSAPTIGTSSRLRSLA